MASRGSLISIFTRLPVPGESKTRLVPVLGDVGAAQLQREMTEHVLLQARICASLESAAVEALIARGSAREARRWLGVTCAPQGDGDLGQRLERAFIRGASRADVTAVVGGDCPAVNAADLREVLRVASLDGAAIIPAHDGGFCALALRSDVASKTRGLLGGVEWGTERACEQTVERLRAAGSETRLLPSRSDVDRPQDIAGWDSIRRAWYEPPTSLDVVVPTLNEAESLPALLSALSADPAVSVIVTDGGSVDGTRGVAERLGATVVTSAPGRGTQMNAGVAASRADALLFLHADTRPPEGFASIVQGVLSEPGCILGAFSFATDSDLLTMRVIGLGTRLRGSLLGMPYGDQGLFCRRTVFDALGGFPEIPVMEDYEFVRRAGRVGRVRIAPQHATTSDRQWRRNGVLRWTALNIGTVVGHHFGATPQQLAEWRRRHSKR